MHHVMRKLKPFSNSYPTEEFALHAVCQNQTMLKTIPEEKGRSHFRLHRRVLNNQLSFLLAFKFHLRIMMQEQEQALHWHRQSSRSVDTVRSFRELNAVSRMP